MRGFILRRKRNKTFTRTITTHWKTKATCACSKTLSIFFWDTLHVKESLLDFGSGPTPVLSELLHRRNVRVDCYDKWYQPKKIYTDRIYDGITSTEVFEHLDDPIAILNELNIHLHQGGIVALMTLFHPKMQADFFQWWYRRDPTHITFYTPKTIGIMAEQCGFEMIKDDGRRIAVLRKR
ncbi:MAG: class I SAM-dependent methyltransferase [Sulfurospirillum cavolei]|nr:class I SAM-dependent methyltransferase [Sulfurospirillum cavolei]